jgi:HSP20 family protein
MLSFFDDWDRGRRELRRQMAHWLDEFESDWPSSNVWLGTNTWPRVALLDDGDKLSAYAEVPGASEKDVSVALDQGALTIVAERRDSAAKGYAVHRRERSDYRIVRSLALPCKVDAENVTATVRNGVLRVTIPKAPDARPQRIEVRTS